MLKLSTLSPSNSSNGGLVGLNESNANNNNETPRTTATVAPDDSQLRNIARRQEIDIAAQQQSLVMKEQRLKYLKQQLVSADRGWMSAESEKVAALRQRVATHESKLARFRSIQQQVEQYKVNNNNLSSELDQVKQIFADKERELVDAVKRVEILTQQLEQLSSSTMTTSSRSSKSTKPHLSKQGDNGEKKESLEARRGVLTSKRQESHQLDKTIQQLQNKLSTIQMNRLSPSATIGAGGTATMNGSAAAASTTNRSSNAIASHNINRSVPASHYAPSLSSGLTTERAVPLDSFMRGSLTQSSIVAPVIPHGTLVPTQPPPQQQPLLPPPASAAQVIRHGSLPTYRYVPRTHTFLKKLHNADHHIEQLYKITFNKMQCFCTHLFRHHRKIDHKPIVAVSSPTTQPPLSAKQQFHRVDRRPSKDRLRRPRRQSSPDPHPNKLPPQIASNLNADEPSDSDSKDKDSDQASDHEYLSQPPTELTSSTTSFSSISKSTIPTVAVSSSSDGVRVASATTTMTVVTSKGVPVKSIVKQRGSAQSTPSKPPRRVRFSKLALLLDAALEGEYELVKQISFNMENISTANDEGITALHNAVCAGHMAIVKFLVEMGADLNAADSDGWTPLHCAASCNNLEALRLLVTHGAAVYATTYSDNETALEKVEESDDGFKACVQYLKGCQDELTNAKVGAMVFPCFNYSPQNPDEIAAEIGDALVVAENDQKEAGWLHCRQGNNGGSTVASVGYFPICLLSRHRKVLKSTSLGLPMRNGVPSPSSTSGDGTSNRSTPISTASGSVVAVTNNEISSRH